MFAYMARDGQLYRNSVNSPALLGLCDIYVDMHATGANTGESWENAFTDFNAGIEMLYCDRLCTDAIQRLHIKGYAGEKYQGGFRNQATKWDGAQSLRLRYIIGYDNPVIDGIGNSGAVFNVFHTVISEIELFNFDLVGVYSDVSNCVSTNSRLEFRHGNFSSITFRDMNSRVSAGDFFYPQSDVDDIHLVGAGSINVHFGNLINSTMSNGDFMTTRDGNMINCSCESTLSDKSRYMIIERGEMINCHGSGVGIDALDANVIDCSVADCARKGINLKNNSNLYNCNVDNCGNTTWHGSSGDADYCGIHCPRGFTGEVIECLVSRCGGVVGPKDNYFSRLGILAMGGVIKNCIIENCNGRYGIVSNGATIESCTARYCNTEKGGFFADAESVIIDCNAIECSSFNGTAGFSANNNSSIRNCIAIDCVSKDKHYAGGFSVYDKSHAIDCRAENCRISDMAFSSIGASSAGGFSTSYGFLTRCEAKNCSALTDGRTSPVAGGFSVNYESEAIDCNAINCFSDGEDSESASFVGGFITNGSVKLINCHAVNCTAAYYGHSDKGSTGGFYSEYGVSSLSYCSASGCSPCGFKRGVKHYQETTYTNCSASGNLCPSDKPVAENKPLWHCCKQSDNDTNYYNCAECGW